MGILSNVQSNKLRFHSSRIDIEFQSYRNVHLNEEVLCSSFLFTFALWKMFKNFVSNRKFSLYRYIYVLLCDILCSVWAFYKTRSEEIKNWTYRIHWTHSALSSTILCYPSAAYLTKLSTKCVCISVCFHSIILLGYAIGTHETLSPIYWWEPIYWNWVWWPSTHVCHVPQQPWRVQYTIFTARNKFTLHPAFHYQTENFTIVHEFFNCVIVVCRRAFCLPWQALRFALINIMIIIMIK